MQNYVICYSRDCLGNRVWYVYRHIPGIEMTILQSDKEEYFSRSTAEAAAEAKLVGGSLYYVEDAADKDHVPTTPPPTTRHVPKRLVPTEHPVPTERHVPTTPRHTERHVPTTPRHTERHVPTRPEPAIRRVPTRPQPVKHVRFNPHVMTRIFDKLATLDGCFL
jgi:hypothetical protein